MEKAFVKEIESQKKELEKSLLSLTSYWMDGVFESETNHRMGRSVDFINKSIGELDKLLDNGE